MTSDFTGFGFLQSAMHLVSDIRRGYGLGGAATPDLSAPATASAIGSATTVDTTHHSASTYMPLPQS